MSTTKNLRGFLPARKRGSGTNSTGVDELPIASGDARNIFTGDLVKTTLVILNPFRRMLTMQLVFFRESIMKKTVSQNSSNIGQPIPVLLILKQW